MKSIRFVNEITDLKISSNQKHSSFKFRFISTQKIILSTPSFQSYVTPPVTRFKTPAYFSIIFRVGFRLTSVKANNSSSPSISTLISPWMKVPFNRVRGVCMTFTYRLLGKDSKLDISVEPKNMNREQIWLVKDPQEDTVWKTGKVSLGLVTEFRVNKSFPFLQSVKVHV